LAALGNILELGAILVDHRIRCAMGTLFPPPKMLRDSPAGADVEGSFMTVRRALYHEGQRTHI
jgi:hypothetical protein